MELVNLIDAWLNKLTMYRLLVYGLGLLIAAAVGLSLGGSLAVSATGIVASLVALVVVCYVANRSFATLSDVPANSESWLITALILCCILPPATTLHRFVLIGLAGLAAIASKYLFVYRRKHICNPAAIAALLLGTSGLLPVIWWIGSPSLLVCTSILGVLVLRKTHRFQLFFCFLAASLVVGVTVSVMQQQTILHFIATLFKSWPLVFLGTIMLTEPETIPPVSWQQRIYGVLVGAIFTSQLRLGAVASTPELALIVANVYSFIVSPRYVLRLALQAKERLAPRIYEFSFAADRPITFIPGQYMQWTLPKVPFDSRGNRRTFSISSAPGQSELRVAIKTAQPGSMFKQTMLGLHPGDYIVVRQLAGDFVLPADTTKPVVCIAGGIGVTPYVSMVRAMIGNKQHRDIVLFYLMSDPAELCFGTLWQQAAPLGLRLIPVLTNRRAIAPDWKGYIGPLTGDIVQKEVLDYETRRYYLSGPSAFVDHYVGVLHRLKIKRHAITTDYFSGY